ncbi:MAG TPA: ferritin-like domain-containing protein [Alphaproteobacteria bacterium]|nr:ferritin-like domain-containing protein [Alphaproteobacteria bacterium]
MSDVITLHDLFIDLLQDIYYAEKKILKALPKLAKAVGPKSKLAAAFLKHRDETEGQVERLEQVFKSIGERAKGKKCPAIDGITEEADELIKEVESLPTLEAGLLAGAQAVEHYEIARYGTLIEWARLMGHDEAVDLLEETLAQEKKTDASLTKLAESDINEKANDAANENNEEDEEEEERSSSRRRRAA